MVTNTTTRITTWIGFIFLIAVLVLPPLCPVHTNPLTSFWTEWFSGILMLVAWGGLFLGNRREFPVPAAIWIWLAWGASLLLSTIFNHYDLWEPVIFAGAFWVMGLLSLLCGAELVLRKGREPVLLVVAYTLLFAGLAQAILGFLRYYGFLGSFSIYLRPLSGSRLQGLFNYPTLTGFSLWLSLCAVAYLFAKRRIGWFVLIVATFIMAIPIVATGNRSSTLYWFCLAFTALLLAIRSRRALAGQSSLEGGRALAGVAVITLTVLVSIPLFGVIDGGMSPFMKANGYAPRSKNVDNLYERKHDFWGIRFNAFHKAIIMAEHAPVFGIGPGNYSYRSFLLNSKMKHAIREGTIDTHSHNIFSMILAENGIFGLLVLVAGCVFMVRWWWKLGPTTEALLTGSVLLDFFAYSNIEYPLWYLNFLVIFMVFCGFVSPTRSEELSSGFLKPLTAGLLLIGGGFFAWESARGYLDISSVPNNHLATVQQAQKLERWFASPLWAADAGVVFEGATIATPHDVEDQLSLAQQVIEHLPTPQALVHKVMLLEYQGKHKEACQLATEAASSYPHADQSFQRITVWYQATTHLTQKQTSTLLSCFDEGVKNWQEQWQ